MTDQKHDVGPQQIFFSVTDDKGVITDANSVFVDISRYSREELTGSPHNIIRNPEMPGGAFRLMWDTLQAGGVWPINAQDVPGKYYLAEQKGQFKGQLPTLPERAEDGAKGVPVYTGKDGQKGIPAMWLWDEIAQHAWSTGEPGLRQGPAGAAATRSKRAE